MTRRGFLGASAGAGLAASGMAVSAQTPAPMASPVASPVTGDGPLRYAVIGDSHIDPSSPDHSEYARQVFAYLDSLDPAPAFVLHVGDVVESAQEEQFPEYDAVLPDAWRDRTYHVPGNHEVRWDERANRGFVERFGQAPYSFDAGGIHFVALDPTTFLQELGQFGDEQLEWLRDDLDAAGAETPTILFFHFPVGGPNYYISDQDAFYETITPFNVIGIHVGHIHRDEVLSMNGFTQAAMRAVRNGPFLHLVDQVDDALEISTVELVDGEPVSELLVTIPLEQDPRFAPVDAEVEFGEPESGAIARITVPVELVQDATQVEVRAWPNHIYAGTDDDQAGWLDLTPDDEVSPTAWADSLYMPAAVSGQDRMEVRASDADGLFRQWAVPFEIEAEDGTAVLWKEEVGDGAVQAGLVTDNEIVVAATYGGELVGYRVFSDGPEEVWRHRDDAEGAGFVGTPTLSGQGVVYAGSRSGRLFAIQVADGAVVWETQLDQPVLGSIASAGDGDGILLVPTHGIVRAINADNGEEMWATGDHGFIGGRASADDQAVYAAFGDGTVRSFDLNDGTERWSQMIADRESPYRQLIYSAWAHFSMLLPGNGQSPEKVLTSTVVSATAHDRETGEVVWEIPGGFMYAASVLLEDGTDTLLLAGEWGRVVSVDPHSGRDNWETELGYRVLNASPVLDGDRLLVPGSGAQVSALDITTGELLSAFQLGGTALVSTPVVVDGLLVAGGQDGNIRAAQF